MVSKLKQLHADTIKVMFEQGLGSVRISQATGIPVSTVKRCLRSLSGGSQIITKLACQRCKQIFQKTSNNKLFCSEACGRRHYNDGRRDTRRGDIFKFNPETDELITRLWNEGVVVKEIAAQVQIASQRTTTRNAIIGRVRRLHLPARASPIAKGSVKQLNYALDLVASRKSEKAAMERKVPKTTLPTLPSVASPSPTCALIEPVLSSTEQCHWIEGDPRSRQWRYCDDPCLAGSPYCPKHRERAYNRKNDTNDFRSSSYRNLSTRR